MESSPKLRLHALQPPGGDEELVLLGQFDGQVDGGLHVGAHVGVVVLVEEGAQVRPAPVEILELGAGDGLSADLGGIDDVDDADDDRATVCDVLHGLEHGHDGPGLPVDDEQQDVGAVLGLGFHGDESVVPVAHLGVVAAHAFGLHGRDRDVGPPGGRVAAAAEEDLGLGVGHGIAFKVR